MIRKARPSDAEALRQLIVTCVPSGIPHTRKATPESVRAFARETYAELDKLLLLPHLVVLVKVERTQSELLGYLMLDLSHVEPSTGEKQCFIMDLGVAPGHRGRFITHQLIERATRLAADRGIEYLAGVVSKSNDRTLKLALKALQFQEERVQIVRRCYPSRTSSGTSS